jgi:ATP synthase protein I
MVNNLIAVRELMNDKNEKDVARKSGMVYAAVLSLLFSVLTMLFVGWALDAWLKTSPWMLVGGIVLGSIVGFYQFIRLLSRT